MQLFDDSTSFAPLSSTHADSAVRRTTAGAASALNATMTRATDSKLFSSLVSWRRAFVLFLAAGVAGWMAIAALIYGSTVAWNLVAGKDDPARVQDIAPAAGPSTPK
jgi:hypothetical protein